MLACTFLIPVRRDSVLSDGKKHARQTLRWLQDELWTRFDGFTIAPGLYRGSYRDPDSAEQVWDKSWRYEVAVARLNLHILRELLAQACVRFQQKCIYLSVAGQVEFVETPNSFGVPENEDG